jgi:hypothetical protein
MDNSAIINLVLVTIIYSTFISPNLEKLGSLRDEIIDTEYPRRGDENYNEKIEQVGVSLGKKLTKYEDKFDEITEFLRYFYWVIGSIFAIQIALFCHSKDHSISKWSPLLIALVVIVILVITLRKYMLHPARIRSMQWLTGKGMPEMPLMQLFGAKITINQRVINSTDDDDEITKISIESKVKLVDYRYILTVESINGERLYYASAGLAARHIRSMGLIAAIGGSFHDLNLASVKLKQNNYRIRLILFISPFGGKHSPTEFEKEFAVENTPNPIEPLEMTNYVSSRRIESTINKRGEITSLTVKEGNINDTSLVALLTSKSFQRVMGHAKRPVILESYNGNLGRYEIDKYCTRRNLLIQKIKRTLVLKRKRNVYIALVPKRKR